MQNDIENILNEIAAKDSQVLCREVLYRTFKMHFLQFLLPDLWASVCVQLMDPPHEKPSAKVP